MRGCDETLLRRIVPVTGVGHSVLVDVVFVHGLGGDEAATL